MVYPKFAKTEGLFLDPFSGVVSNATGLDTIIQNLNLIPKFQVPSRSSLSYLQFIKQICATSGTHKSCLRVINKYAFWGRPQIIKSEIAGIENERIFASTSEKQRFLDVSKRLGLSFIQLTEAIKSANKSFSESGDAYIYVRLLSVNGLWVTHIENIPFDEFMYWGGDDFANPKMDSRVGVWCSDWSQRAIMDGKYKVVNVTKILEKVGNWNKTKGGFETIFHIKDGNASKVYGEFELYSIVKALMTEISEDGKVLKTSQTALTALSMLFLPVNPLETDGEESNIDDAKKRFNDVGTNTGQGQEFVIGEYYAKDGKPELVKLDVHRDSVWSQYIDNKSTNKIHGYHNVSPNLTSSESRSTGFASSPFLDELIKFNGSNIEPLQQYWENCISEIFSRMGELTGTQEMIDYSIIFENRIEKLITTLKGTPTNAPTIDAIKP